MPQDFDASADLGNNEGKTTSLSASYTVGSGANRLLVVGILGDLVAGADDITSVTFAGQALTLGAKNTGRGGSYPSFDRFLYGFFLLNPPTGAHTVLVSSTTSHFLGAVAADYVGMAQSGQPDTTAAGIIPCPDGSTVTLTIPITTSAANDWLIGIGSGYGHPDSFYSSDDLTFRVVGAEYGMPILFDSNAAVAAGSNTTHFTLADPPTYGSNDIMSVVLAFAPASAGADTDFVLGTGTGAGDAFGTGTSSTDALAVDATPTSTLLLGAVSWHWKGANPAVNASLLFHKLWNWSAQPIVSSLLRAAFAGVVKRMSSIHWPR